MPTARAARDDRIELRATREEKRLLARAAAYQRLDMTGFIMRSALPAARQIVDMAEQVALSERDSARVLALLENPPEPTPALAAAARRQVARSTAADADGGRISPNLGPFRDEAAALSFLVGRLRAALRPEAVFLFGSRATGTARADSDFDLLVILPDDGGGPPDPFAAYAPVAGCGLGVDVVPCRAADFAADRRRAGTLAHAADRDGRLLYARPGGPFRRRRRDARPRR